MTDEALERALTNEVGPPRLRQKLPTSSERYAVSTWVWAEWNRINDQIKNIPWWHINLRRRAARKYRQFQTALHVLHHYVPTQDKE